MIYPDHMLEKWATGGGLRPFDPALLNPGSVDLRWSGRYRMALRGPKNEIGQAIASVKGWKGAYHAEAQLAQVLVLMPGDLYLLDTAERIVIPDDACGDVKLKSSLGRVGLEHLHAGWCDPGFSGTLTLEVTNMAPWPIEIHTGDPIVQLVLMAMLAPPNKTYRDTGRYNGQREPQVALPPKTAVLPYGDGLFAGIEMLDDAYAVIIRQGGINPDGRKRKQLPCPALHSLGEVEALLRKHNVERFVIGGVGHQRALELVSAFPPGVGWIGRFENIDPFMEWSPESHQVFINRRRMLEEARVTTPPFNSNLKLLLDAELYCLVAAIRSLAYVALGETAVPDTGKRVTPASAEHVLAYVLNGLEQHHMSRPGIPTLVKNAQAMLDGREVKR